MNKVCGFPTNFEGHMEPVFMRLSRLKKFKHFEKAIEVRDINRVHMKALEAGSHRYSPYKAPSDRSGCLYK